MFWRLTLSPSSGCVRNDKIFYIYIYIKQPVPAISLLTGALDDQMVEFHNVIIPLTSGTTLLTLQHDPLYVTYYLPANVFLAILVSALSNIISTVYVTGL
jgi:hypothetical protein